ncbi:MAG TPA: amidase [Opitutaceae bacterium]
MSTPFQSSFGASRRNFLRTTAAGAAAAAIASRFTASARAAGPAYPTSSDKTSELIYMSATKLAGLIREKKVSAAEAVKACLARIEAVNPKLNAVVTLCAERALLEAREADAALAKGQIKGALHGVPFTIKDSLETAGVVSTTGTLGRKTFVPGDDATVVARVRAAGGILLGKTNTPEFTLGGGDRGTYNLVYGQTYNPYNLAHTPRGSSGGAGAIVSAGGSAFDIGSDFGGSIRSPAHACGIAGIKPTLGRVPRSGHLPGYGGAWDTYQELGPLARRVEDIALITSIISGADFLDPLAADVPFGDFHTVNLKELRVAYYFDNKVHTPTPETFDAMRTALKAIEGSVASMKEDFHGGDAEWRDLSPKLLKADAGAWRQRLLKKHGTTQASPGFADGIGGDPIKSSDFTALVEQRDALRSRLLGWLESYDVIICPTNAFPAPALAKPVPGTAGYTSIYNLAGWPAAVVRAGTAKAEGLPIGIQVVGQPWREDVVFAVAAKIEAATGGWQKPPI